MSRKKRLVEKVFKVFCEGDTEYNYLFKILYLFLDYPHKYYVFKYFEV